jgi:hypothetical protein
MPEKDGPEGLGSTYNEESGYMVNSSESTNELPPFDEILYVIV